MISSDLAEWPHAVERNGFAIASNVFSQEEMSGLIEDFEAANLTRSRAGVRHAMASPVVAAVAKTNECWR